MKNRFFAKHAKSSALVVSLAIHVLIIVVALSFVAVTIIQKQSVDFEAKEINRPKMKLRKLQVPVNVKKPPQQPKLRKQIVVKPNVARITPDIKMPEIVGVKGGLGAGGGGFGAIEGLGFSMPEISLFGVKGKGEKIFIILDSSPEMMADEIGGIPAYTIIKQQLVRVLGGLPPTAVFNVAVYEHYRAVMRFPEMVPASAQNVEQVEQWLEPLNAVRQGMGDKDYGIRTLGEGGTKIEENLSAGKVENVMGWYRPAGLAMKQQADTVFVLTCTWGIQWHYLGEMDNDDWKQSSAGRRWQEAYEAGRKKLAEENRQRAEKGDPPRVIADNPWEINRIYFPGIERPPVPPKYHYTPHDFSEAFLDVRKQFRSVAVQDQFGLRKTKSDSKVDFSFNVIHFLKTSQSSGTGRQQSAEDQFKQLVNLCQGEYRTLAGLEAIKSSISP